MYKIEINVDRLIEKLGTIERSLVPRVYVQAANATAFQVRDRWKTRIGEVFDRPVPLTRNAALYKRATPATLTAEIFIRDEASKGTPPVKYLFPQEEGVARRQKRFERKLERHPRARKFYVPGRQADLDAHGNLPRQLYTKIFAQLQAAENVSGFSANESAAGRRRRLARQRRKGGGGSYFILPANRGKLKAGVVYERINDLAISDAGKARATSQVRAILFPVNRAPTYTRRLQAVAIARDIVAARFPKNFRFYMAQALRKRGFVVI